MKRASEQTRVSVGATRAAADRTQDPETMSTLRKRPDGALLALWLCGVGGYLDAHIFVAYHVFANAQTGNVVLLGLNGAAGRWTAALRCLTPIGAFAAGDGRPAPGSPTRSPSAWPPYPRRCSCTFRSLDGQGYTTTLTTANFRSVIVALCAWRLDGGRTVGRSDGRTVGRSDDTLASSPRRSSASASERHSVPDDLAADRVRTLAPMGMLLGALVVRTSRPDGVGGRP